MLNPFARALRLASIFICLIAIASFVLFVVNQTSAASTSQQAVLNGEKSAPNSSEPSPSSASGATSPVAAGPTSGGTKAASATRESSLRRAIDDASSTLTSPFSGVTAGSSSEWVTRGVRLLLALAVYGFGLGYLARLIRVRV